MQYPTKKSWRQPRYVASVLAFALLAASGFAFAEPRGPGPYFGLGFGQSTMKDASTALLGTPADDTDTAVKIFGGYMFNPYLGLELGYIDFGTFRGSFPREDWSATSLDFSVVGVLPVPDVNSNFSLFGKFGANFWGVADHVAGFGTVSTSGTDASYGLGAELGLSPNAGLNLQWERFTNVGDPNITGKSDLDLVSLNFVYHFGEPRNRNPYRRRYPY
jgi:OOP family OmpA-OmpF porin